MPMYISDSIIASMVVMVDDEKFMCALQNNCKCYLA